MNIGTSYPILDGINSPLDIKQLSFQELEALSVELRQFLIDSVSRTGGISHQIWVWLSLPLRFIVFLILPRTRSFGMWGIKPIFTKFSQAVRIASTPAAAGWLVGLSQDRGESSRYL
jgi:hypothetical protein